MFLDDGFTTATCRSFPRKRRRSWRTWPALASGSLTLVVGAVAAVVAGSVGSAGAASSATASGQTTFTFTGTVKGTLSAPDSACSDGIVSAQGATFMLTGSLNGAPAVKWTLQLYNPKAGTSTKFDQLSGNGPAVTLIGTDANGNQNWNWTSVSKHGSITTSKTSGKVNIILGPYSSFRGKAGKGHVHVVGSWGCTS